MIAQNFIKWGLEGKLTLIGTQELLTARVGVNLNLLESNRFLILLPKENAL